jgi:hypothetical protein
VCQAPFFGFFAWAHPGLLHGQTSDLPFRARQQFSFASHDRIATAVAILLTELPARILHPSKVLLAAARKASPTRVLATAGCSVDPQ